VREAARRDHQCQETTGMNLFTTLRISVAAALVATALLRPAAADVVCGQADAQGVQECSTGLSAELASRMYVEQSKSQWCWAAAMSMVFARYGYPLQQQDVVERLYGTPVDMPVRRADLAPLINRDWYAGDGRKVTAVTRPVGLEGTAVQAAAGAQMLIDTLAQQQPLLLGTRGHMVVVVGVSFQRFTQQGALRLSAVTVLDPAQGAGSDLKQVPAAELRSRFLVSVALVPQVSGDFASVRQLNAWKVSGATVPGGETLGGEGRALQ
jgi:hypothetical protein